MSSPYEKALQKSKGSDLSRLSQAQRTMYKGFSNKASGIVIRTDPTTTAKGNRTCAMCKAAKANGSPLPPDHPNCRCSIQIRK